MVLKDWEVAPGGYAGYRSRRWRQKNKEYPIFVQVSNTFIGDRKPEVNIWKQQKDQNNMADYIASGKKFDTKKEAYAYAKKYREQN